MISFLDVIACAFGAIVLLVLILPVGDQVGVSAENDFDSYEQERRNTRELIRALEELRADKIGLVMALSSLRKAKARSFEDVQLTKETEKELEIELNELKTLNVGLRSALEQRVKQTKEKVAPDLNTLATHKLGIPVDSEYLVFVIDSSGSMQSIWPRVVSTMQRLLRLYPGLKGFQILNDQGEYLYKAKKSGWISDSPVARKQAMSQLKNWSPYSNSSPIEGIQQAVENLVRSGDKTAIFVLGDDYSQTDFDSYLARIKEITSKKFKDGSDFRIHAIGFANESSSTHPERFGILMRSLALQHNGSYLVIGNRKASPVDIRRGDRFVKQD